MSRVVAAITSLSLFASVHASACSTCFGDPQDPQTHGMNAAIFTLLGVTYGLFCAMFAAGFVIWRRNRMRATGAPDSDGEAAQESAQGPQHG